MSSLKTAVVAIGRRENLYAREFVEHYQKIGFDNVIIMDNNYGDEEHFEDVLQDYVESGFVIIENYRDQIKAQMRGYTEMYAKYKDKYDWIAFFDFDEFLILKWHNTIGEYLEKFPDDCQTVLVNWLCMTDNDLVEYDDRPLMERFTEPMPLDRHIQYNFPDNCHVKSIIKGGLNAVFGGNPHTTDSPTIAYNAAGDRTENRPWQPMTYSMAYLKHFTTKTIEEWMTRKMVVGTPDREPSSFLPFYRDRFFKINQVTDEKLNWLKEHGYAI